MILLPGNLHNPTKITRHFYTLTLMLMLVLLLFSASVPRGYAFAGRGASGEELPEYAAKRLEKPSFELDVRQADLRDVLSALALKMDRTIILLGDPRRVTFSVENVTPMTAMTLLLQNEGLDYIEDDGCMLVGLPEMLKNNYFGKMALTRFYLHYISATVLAGLVGELGIPMQILSLETNPKSVWVQGTPRELGKLREIITALDQPENADPETASHLERLELQYLNAETIRPLIEQLALSVQVVTMPANPQALWAQGAPAAVERLRELVVALDRPENAGLEAKLELPSIFIYQLNNISATDAAKRLGEMAVFEEVKVLTFNYPEISRELLVVCPYNLNEQVYKALELLDGARRRIRMPVDSSDKRGALAARRELLAELTGISISRMFISANISGDSENPYYVLWVDEAPDKVQQVRDMVEIIDEPRSGR